MVDSIISKKDKSKDKTVEELRKMASRKKIEGRSKMNKSQLIRALKKKTSTKTKRIKMRGGAFTPFTGNIAEFYNRVLEPYQILILNNSLGIDVFSPVVYLNPNTNNPSMLNVSYILRNPTEVLNEDINISGYNIYINNNTIRFRPAFPDILGGLTRVDNSILLIPRGTEIKPRNYHLFPDVRAEEEYKGYSERPVNVSTIRNYNVRRETNFNPERLGEYFDHPVKINIEDILEPNENYQGLEIRSISGCVKELIQFSYFFYNSLLKSSQLKTPPTQISIVCGGQSPAYYALSMMNLPIYNPELVNVVIIPHSTGGGERLRSEQTDAHNMKYCERLREKGVIIHPYVFILDLVESGRGVLSLKRAIQKCYELDMRKIKIYAIKADQNKAPRIGSSNGLVKTYDQYCFAFFRQMFRRIVPTYKPEQFNRKILPLPNLDEVYAENPLARMIRDCSRVYPYVPIEETPWYRLNREPH